MRMPSLHVVGAVGVGVERHAVAERLADQRDQGLGAAGERIDVAVHPPAEAELDRLGAGVGDELLQVLDFLLGRVAAIAAGVVDGDVLARSAAEEIGHGPLRRLAHQLQQRHLDRRDAGPQGDALQLVVAVVAIARPRAATPACARPA